MFTMVEDIGSEQGSGHRADPATPAQLRAGNVFFIVISCPLLWTVDNNQQSDKPHKSPAHDCGGRVRIQPRPVRRVRIGEL